MPWQKLPINQEVYTNIDEVSLSSRTPERHDTYRNAAGATLRRPGFAEFCDTATDAPVDGMYNWEEQDLVIIVADKNVYKKDETGAISELGTDLFVAGQRPTFANFGDTLYAANGGDIIKITTATATALADADIPDAVSHVAAFDTYMLCNKGDSGQMHYSNVLDPETWDAEFVTAEQAPDDLTAVHARWHEIWLFGKRTIERWYNDGVTPFVPLQGGVISCGCPAPDTIQWIQGGFYWLNENREVVRSAGQNYEILSGPVHDLIREAKTVSDAIGDYITVGGNNFYALSLPDYGSYGLTLVYDIGQNEWQGQWNYWDSENSRYERFRGNCYTYVPAWNKHLLGDRSNGKVYYMRTDKYQDDGDTMRSCWLTGWIDHGTAQNKRSHKVRFRIRRGEGEMESSPVLMLRWRDDGSKTWGNTHELDLGETGEYEFYVSLRRLGMYRSRQYELSVTDDVPVVIADAEELVEVLA
jgi:hypothetical protein